jgi:LEA14-like dessication related protein
MRSRLFVKARLFILAPLFSFFLLALPNDADQALAQAPDAPDLSSITNVKMSVVSVGLALKKPPAPAEMVVGLKVENVRSDLLKLESMKYVVYVESEEFCKGSYPPAGETVSIQPDGTAQFSVRTAVPLEKMMAVGQKMMSEGRRKPKCRVEGTAKLRPPVGEAFSLPFKFDKIDIDLKKVKVSVELPDGLPLELPLPPQGDPTSEGTGESDNSPRTRDDENGSDTPSEEGNSEHSI